MFADYCDEAANAEFIQNALTERYLGKKYKSLYLSLLGIGFIEL